MWILRVREWRESGLSAEAFARGKGYSGSGLRSAESQLRRGAVTTDGVPVTTGKVEAGPSRGQTPRFLPVRVRDAERASVDVVVEVGQARIRLSPGTDLAFLSDIVRALTAAV